MEVRGTRAGKPAAVSTYAKGFDEPFGLAFYPPGPEPQYLYIGTVGAVLRLPYRNGDAQPGPSLQRDLQDASGFPGDGTGASSGGVFGDASAPRLVRNRALHDAQAGKHEQRRQPSVSAVEERHRAFDSCECVGSEDAQRAGEIA